MFDLDGVLIDSRDAVRHAYRDVGVVMPRDAWGLPWKSWLPRLVTSDDEAARRHDRKNEIYPEKLSKYARELPLANLARTLTLGDYPVYVITGASLLAATAALKVLDIPSYVLYDYEMTVEGKSIVLAEMADSFYQFGVYFDDHDGVAVPHGWQKVRVN